jgi:ribonuclease P protein component
LAGLFLEPEWFAIRFGQNASGILMNIPPQPASSAIADGARLRKHADYQRAYAASRKRQSASMSWFLAPQSSYPGAESQPPGPRVGLTAGKVLGKAHERNRIKRRMREAYAATWICCPAGCDLILHPRRSGAHCRIQET